MKRIVIHLLPRVKLRLRRLRRSTQDAGLAQRCQIILQAGKGRSSRVIAEGLGCSRSWVSRVIARFIKDGEAGLVDRRKDNGIEKLDECYLGQLHEVVEQRPPDFGYSRPTWTRELLVKVMLALTAVEINVATMSRALKKIHARRGRPRPTVGCPWSKQAKNKRLKKIRALLKNLPANEVAVYEDEVDVHLNPKIGLDWMNRGQQKQVLTPGQNQKRYLAGALDARTGQLTCVEAEQKNSMLFIMLLHALRKTYPNAKKIHVVLDNYRIHSSDITKAVIASLDGRIALHFLPPYCPNENRIERVWQDLHAEVTRNHMCKSMRELMRNVRRFLRLRNQKQLPASRGKAA